MIARGACALVIAVVGAAVVASCTPDPTHDNQVNALGPETNGGPGPLHRAGQPCLVCHGGDGPASHQFSVAGTVYQSLADLTPLVNAQVQVFDANGTEHDATTNDAGNFYVDQAVWAPTYPLHNITINYLSASNSMTTTVGRDGSCATCHFDVPNADGGRGVASPGHVYLVLDPADLPQPGDTGGGNGGTGP